MFRKKYIRIFVSLIIGVILIAVSAFTFRTLLEARRTYLSIEDGQAVRAVVHRLPNQVYHEGETNYYRYTFIVDGITYASATMHTYSQVIESESYNFIVLYALDEDGKVKVLDDEFAVINEVKCPLAISYEQSYINNSRPPGIAMSIVIFVIAGLILMFCLYNWIWVLFYKNIVSKGVLTYGIFVEASSKNGSRKYMSITFKYKDLEENWLEAKTPYTYTTLDVEKLMLLETFKIRYKGKHTLIVEQLKGLRLN